MREKQYTPDMVSRNVRQQGNGVIEIARYNVGHMKANMAWPWFIIVISMTLYDVYFQKGMFTDIQWAISVDWALSKQWNEILETYTALGKTVPIGEYNIYI